MVFQPVVTATIAATLQAPNDTVIPSRMPGVTTNALNVECAVCLKTLNPHNMPEQESRPAATTNHRPVHHLRTVSHPAERIVSPYNRSPLYDVLYAGTL